jgi:hypothetical protein
MLSCNYGSEFKRDEEKVSKENKQDIIFIEENKIDRNEDKIEIKTDSLDEENIFFEFCGRLSVAMEKNDTIELDKYLDSAVIFRGYDDDDPAIEISGRERIFLVREIFLNYFYDDYKNDTAIMYKDFFLDKNALNKEYKENKDIQFIDDFTFKKNKLGEWRLVEVYTNITELKKKLRNKSSDNKRIGE